MRVGVTIGKIGDKFKVLALPDVHIRKQRDLVKKIQLAKGQHEGDQLDRVMMFESPPAKHAKFAKAASKKVEPAKKAANKSKQ